MRENNILTDDGAVSSVISVILMLSVVVVLGTVVLVFAVSIGESVSSPAPSATFEVEILSDGDLRVTHTGGDPIDGNQLRFAGAALEKTSVGSLSGWSGNSVNAGDSTTVNVKGGETLRLIWQFPESDVTATLMQYDVSDDVDPAASIGSVDTDWYTFIEGRLTVTNIQFSRAHDHRVYVVVEDEPSGGTTTNKTYFSTNGGDLPVRLIPDSNVGGGETITVTVYETDRKLIELATATGVVP